MIQMAIGGQNLMSVCQSQGSFSHANMTFQFVKGTQDRERTQGGSGASMEWTVLSLIERVNILVFVRVIHSAALQEDPGVFAHLKIPSTLSVGFFAIRFVDGHLRLGRYVKGKIIELLHWKIKNNSAWGVYFI